MTAADAAAQRADSTDLERRVLAHERILQTLIAYMSITEPRFVEHLRGRFVAPMRLARREHEYRDVHDYAEEFVRAVMLLDERDIGASAAAAPPPPSESGGRPELSTAAVSDPVARVSMREKGGVWAVEVDGVFWGDYRERRHAAAAMAVAKLSLP